MFTHEALVMLPSLPKTILIKINDLKFIQLFGQLSRCSILWWLSCDIHGRFSKQGSCWASFRAWLTSNIIFLQLKKKNQ